MYQTVWMLEVISVCHKTLSEGTTTTKKNPLVYIPWLLSTVLYFTEKHSHEFLISPPASLLLLLSGPVRRVPPRFSIPPADSEIMPGGNINITCVAVGSPMPYVKWMLGAEDLTPEDDMPIGRNVLELTDVRQSNNYTCVAMSTLGVIEAVAQIIVKGAFISMCMRRLMDEQRRACV